MAKLPSGCVMKAKEDHSASFASVKALTKDTVISMGSGMPSTIFLMSVMAYRCEFSQDQALSFERIIHERRGTMALSLLQLDAYHCGRETEGSM